MVEVTVEDGKLDIAIKQLKKQLSRAGVLRRLKEKRFYEPPSAKKQRKRKEMIRRQRKNLRKKFKRF